MCCSRRFLYDNDPTQCCVLEIHACANASLVRRYMHAPGPSPYYSTQDSKLVRHTIAGLLSSASDDLRNEWNGQANPHIVVGDQITGDHLENCDCAVEIITKPPLIILWTRRLLDSPLPTNQDHRPRPKRKLTSHKEDDKPP
jgi:hypothetical protein